MGVAHVAIDINRDKSYAELLVTSIPKHKPDNVARRQRNLSSRIPRHHILNPLNPILRPFIQLLIGKLIQSEMHMRFGDVPSALETGTREKPVKPALHGGELVYTWYAGEFYTPHISHISVCTPRYYITSRKVEKIGDRENKL
jgi:hypothetical protein